MASRMRTEQIRQDEDLIGGSETSNGTTNLLFDVAVERRIRIVKQLATLVPNYNTLTLSPR